MSIIVGFHPTYMLLPHAIEYPNENNRISVSQFRSPSRRELIEEAMDAFSNPETEHLTNVTRSRNLITGETNLISGKIVQKNKNFLSKLFNLGKKIKL